MLSVGYTVDVVSPGKPFPGTVKTAVHDFEAGDATYCEKAGHAFALTRAWDGGRDLSPDHYDALFLPGGRAPEYLRLDAEVMAVVSTFFGAALSAAPKRGRRVVIVAVCHGVQFLAALDRGMRPTDTTRLTGYPACGPDMRAAGCGAWTDCPPDGAVSGRLGPHGVLITSPAWPGHPAVLRELYAAVGTTIEHAEA